MPLPLPSFTDLDPVEVDAMLEEAAERLQEDNPRLDLKRGPNHDLLLYPGSIYATAVRTIGETVQQSQTFIGIRANPTTADEATVDGLLSNYRLVRQTGAPARGQVVLVVSSPSTVVIGANARFNGNGQAFITESVFTAKVDAANILGETDRLLREQSDGSYAFEFEVVAVEEGPSGNVAKDTPVVPESPPAAYVRSYAASDFTGGRDVETNADYMARMDEGQAARIPGNPTNMSAMLMEEDAFDDFVATSIVGAGDSAMLRDRQSLFPIATGGKVDWVIRATALPQRTLVTKTAVFVEDTSAGGVWRISFDRDEAPGMYEARSILPAGSVGLSGTLAISSDTRVVDVTDLTYKAPTMDAADPNQFVYTPFQSAVIEFVDYLTPTSGLVPLESTGSYDVEVVAQPQLAQLQAFIQHRSRRAAGSGDVLVRAPVPCFVAVSVTATLPETAVQPDDETVRNEVAVQINNLGFPGSLSASTVSNLIYEWLPAGSTLSPVDLLGKIRRPDGSLEWLHSNSELKVPDRPEMFTTANTVCFYVEPDDIEISWQRKTATLR